MVKAYREKLTPESFAGGVQAGTRLSPVEFANALGAFEEEFDKAIDAGTANYPNGNPDVVKSINTLFAQAQAQSAGGLTAALAKDISTTVPLNSSNTPTVGFMPFDLEAPSR